jgi:DNA-binding transcriptional MerR regulator
MHSITALCRMTGLKASTLRTWERRYGVPRAGRADSGRRRYSEEEVERIQLLAALVARGRQIGDLVHYSVAELKALAPDQDLAPGALASEAALRRLTSAIGQGDLIALRRCLGETLATLPPEDVISRVLSPMLMHVGEGWEAGRYSVALEHAVSALTKQSLLANAAAQGWHGEGDPFLFSTFEGEAHEFGSLFAWYLAVTGGLNAIYLGPHLPVGEVSGALRLFGARTLVLSRVRPSTEFNIAGAIADMDAQLPPGVEVWIGARAEDAIHRLTPSRRFRLFASYGGFVPALRARAQARD